MVRGRKGYQKRSKEWCHKPTKDLVELEDGKERTSSKGKKGECERWSGRAQAVNATYLPFGYQNIY